MPPRIYRNSFEDCAIGISLSENSNAEVFDNKALRTGIAIEVRDAADVRAKLGISDIASNEDIARMLSALEAAQSKEEAPEIAKAAGAERLLAAGSNLTTLLSGFYQLKDSGLVRAVREMLLPGTQS